MALLTGCSARTEKTDFKVTAEREEFYHPSKPRKAQIADEKFVNCNVPGYVCLSKADAKRVIGNKVEAGRVIKQYDAIVDYYRCFGSEPDGGRPVACANALKKNKNSNK